MTGTILVVEDDSYVRSSLETWLERRGFVVRSVASAEEALEQRVFEGVDTVITDLKLPGIDGRSLLERLREKGQSTPVVVITGHGTVDSAVECMKAGAADYLLKPIDADELTLVAERVMSEGRLQREVAYLRTAVDDREHLPDGPLGESAAWREVLGRVDAASPVDAPVLVSGETGSGKEEVARLIHRQSRRSDGPFVSVNCAAIPVELFESEFFGHVRGAFTGASEEREGRFRVADGGTLFLDEIDALPLTAQPKILRVLENGQFERVGESRPTKVDVRLVSATNTDLRTAVEEGAFRQDLYYRLNVFTIDVPPLRARGDDVLLLAETFLTRLAGRYRKPVPRLSDEARATLSTYAWPGNVRELRNVLERAVLLTGGEEIGAGDLEIHDSREDAAHPIRDRTDLELRPTLLETERELIEESLRRSDGVRREAARLLGIDERNMSYYLNKHDID